jgi:hypothetical protein
MPIDLGCPIVHASCADPYVILLSEDGQVMLLTLRDVRGTAKLYAQTANLLFVSTFILILILHKLILINYNIYKQNTPKKCSCLYIYLYMSIYKLS